MQPDYLRMENNDLYYAERPITIEECNDLRILLFGEITSSFGEDWNNQEFKFKNSGNQLFGLIQNRPGPCGFLAAIQGHLLYEFMFGYAQGTIHMAPSIDEKKLALARVLTYVLFQAGDEKGAILAVKEDKPAFAEEIQFARDGLIEQLHLKIFQKKENLMEFFENTILSLMEGSNSSCVTFLYSVILTRGIQRIKEEMDSSNQTLIGCDGYGTMEIVNLLLIGKAVTNPFDGCKHFDAGEEGKTILYGIGKQSRIGFLSSSEYTGDIIVGNFYKDPECPIWVLSSGTHFSVLFSHVQNVLAEKNPTDTIHLFHYDGLAKDDKEEVYCIKITEEIAQHNDQFTYVELCILTKWPNAKFIEP